MKVSFVEGFDSPRLLLEMDMPAAPGKQDNIVIGGALYTINSIRHVFEPTGRGGRHDYEVAVHVQKVV